MTLTTIALIALAVWLITGTLMLATRDPLAFAHLFWGLVTITAWPIALWADRAVKKRRAKAVTNTVIETPLPVTDRAALREHAVGLVEAAVGRAVQNDSHLLLAPERASITKEIETERLELLNAHSAALTSGNGDPVEALRMRKDRTTVWDAFHEAHAVVTATLRDARDLDEEGERAAVPLVGDLHRRLTALKSADHTTGQVNA